MTEVAFTKVEYDDVQHDLEEWKSEWEGISQQAGVRLNIPGMVNGLMARFSAEAIALGALEFKHPPSDYKLPERKLEMNWEKERKGLSDWLEKWHSQATTRGMNWYPPGLQNGLMAQFIAEATYIGALTLREPTSINKPLV